MSTKAMLEVQHFSKALCRNSWKFYLKFLRQVEVSNDVAPLRDIIRLFESGDIKGGLDIADSLSQQKYLTAAEHFAANQVSLLIRKYPFPPSRNPYDPEGEAKRKFAQAEELCSSTNARLRSPLGESEEILARARAFVRYVLGDEPDLASIYDECDFGPGASIGVHGNATNWMRKLFASKWSVNPSAFHDVVAAISRNVQLLEFLFKENGKAYYCCDHDLIQGFIKTKCEFVDYNKIAFVPKTAKTHRSIAVEPLLNTFVQKGIDSFMRQRLLRIGIDLSDQGINSRYALYGSCPEFEDPFCTIDLESASDSVSTELVRSLLPPEWFSLLDRTRSKHYLDPDSKTSRSYNKFCSMGNGFCFPLETLIFASLCHAAGAGNPKTDFLVYGDDIIVRRSSVEEVFKNLSLAGLVVNPRKTFIEGPFRESCGADWFGGEDVRPVTLDFAFDSLEALHKFANLTHRNSRTKSFFSEAVEFIKNSVPENITFKRPRMGSPEGAFTVSHDEFMSSRFARWETNKQCWSWFELSKRPVKDPLSNRHWLFHIALVIAALRGSASALPFTMRRKTRTNIRRVLHS